MNKPPAYKPTSFHVFGYNDYREWEYVDSRPTLMEAKTLKDHYGVSNFTIYAQMEDGSLSVVSEWIQAKGWDLQGNPNITTWVDRQEDDDNAK